MDVKVTADNKQLDVLKSARRWRCHPNSIRAALRKGLIPYERHGTKIFISIADLDAWGARRELLRQVPAKVDSAEQVRQEAARLAEQLSAPRSQITRASAR